MAYNNGYCECCQAHTIDGAGGLCMMCEQFTTTLRDQLAGTLPADVVMKDKYTADVQVMADTAAQYKADANAALRYASELRLLVHEAHSLFHVDEHWMERARALLSEGTHDAGGEA